MQISKLRLENYGVFTDAEFTLATKEGSEDGSNITVFIGNNGSGKTSILDAIATGLSWFVAKLENKETKGNFANKSKINLSANYCSISFEKRNQSFVSPNKVIPSMHPDDLSLKLKTVRNAIEDDNNHNKCEDSDIISFTTHFRGALVPILKSKRNFPIAAYYGATRHTYDSTINSAIQPNNSHQFDILSAYKGL